MLHRLLTLPAARTLLGLLAAACVVVHGRAAAAPLTVHAEWSYAGTADNFILYLNGSELCRAPGAPPFQIDCQLPSPPPGPLVFTMAAEDADLNLSPVSLPYTVDPPPPIIVADAEDDNDIDGSDLALFIQAFAAGTPEADLNADNQVSPKDADVFGAVFGWPP